MCDFKKGTQLTFVFHSNRECNVLGVELFILVMLIHFKIYGGQKKRNSSGRAYNFSVFANDSLTTIQKCYPLGRDWQFINLKQ